MDSISKLLLATHPLEVVECSRTLRIQSLLLTLFSCLGVLLSIVNFSGSPYYSLISGLFFIISSLTGVPVGIYAYNTSRKVKTPFVTRYRNIIILYAVSYLLFLVTSGVLQYLAIMHEDANDVDQIAIGVGLLVLFLAMIPLCWFFVRTGRKFSSLVLKYEKEPFSNGRQATHDEIKVLTDPTISD